MALSSTFPAMTSRAGKTSDSWSHCYLPIEHAVEVRVGALGGPVIEVVAKATRRRFTVEYKRRTVRAADANKTPSAGRGIAAAGGLYSSHLTTWRAARERGELVGAAKKRAGRPGVWWTRATRSSPSRSARLAGGSGAPSEQKRWLNCKNKWRRCWEPRWPARPRDGDGHPDRTAAAHRPHVTVVVVELYSGVALD
jgi:hypothetical protein